ncbi:B3 domain-containing protein [Drosera capensis]
MAKWEWERRAPTNAGKGDYRRTRREWKTSIFSVYPTLSTSSSPNPLRTYGVSKKRDLSNRVYASEEVRACALEKAEQSVSEKLDSSYPTLVRSMLPSHVTGGFWLA